MKINGVSFNVDVVKSIDRDVFIRNHMFCYRDKPESERRLFLGSVWDKINGVEKVETAVETSRKAGKKKVE
jgi:hypothetical protein